MFINHMQYDIIICLIIRMAVCLPVRCANMNFHISNPFYITHAHSGVEEIRPGIMIMLSYTQYDNRLTINGGQPVVEQLMLPHVL